MFPKNILNKKDYLADKSFILLADLGICTIPENYVHNKQLSLLDRKNFYYFNKDILDKNFPNPNRIFKPGEEFYVCVFKQNTNGRTTTKKRMEFLAKQNAVYAGAQGVSVVYEQKRDQLPKGYWYLSFDEKKRLWEDKNRSYRIPYLGAYTDGNFEFNISFFEDDFNENIAFFGFYEK